MIPNGIILGFSSRQVRPRRPRDLQLRANAKGNPMDKYFRPEIVRATARTGEVLHISGIRSHAPALGGSVVPPWPRQDGWQRHLNAAAGTGKEGKPKP
jgi:hypothetical protein